MQADHGSTTAIDDNASGKGEQSSGNCDDITDVLLVDPFGTLERLLQESTEVESLLRATELGMHGLAALYGVPDWAQRDLDHLRGLIGLARSKLAARLDALAEVELDLQRRGMPALIATS